MHQHRVSRRFVIAGIGGVAEAVVLARSAQARITTPTGVILLHGKSGDPNESASNIRQLAALLQSSGCRVVQPEMPWSKRRYITVPYELGQDEIAAHVAQLRSSGSAKVIVGGISLGANGALCYAARTGGIDGLMLFSLGQWPEYMTVHRKEFVEAAARAQEMIKAGKGDETANWYDTNSSQVLNSRASAKVYFSYHDRFGPVVVTPNFRQLDADLPLLVVAARSDQPDANRTQALFHARLRPPTSQFLMFEQGATHFNTADMGRGNAMEWLLRLNETWKA